ncbi:MAG: adenylate/guanylate cyclase domain-containing protein [Tepidiformaceae bacterium]
MYTETVAHAMVAGWSGGDAARNFAALMRAAVSQEDLVAASPDTIEGPRQALDLSQVRAPTLVMHRRDAQVWSLDDARRLAAGIPDARLVVLDGGSLLPYVGDLEQVVAAAASFLGLESRAEPTPEPHHHHDSGDSSRTILFTDMVGHTTMMQRLGDRAGREVLREHERLTREALHDHGGDEVKSMGDGFLASFGSATRALQCATALQQAFARHNAGGQEPVLIRVGVNAGEPIAEQDDLFGSSVIAASRIAAHGAGGEVLVSNVVRELVAGKGFLFSDRGETALRGFDDPVKLYELRWQAAE